MGMKNRLYVISLFLGNSLCAQNNCNCEVALEKLMTTIEHDYPGFKEKTASDTGLYNNHKKAALEKSKTTDNQECIKVLNEYASFFKDEHIYLEGKTGNRKACIK